MVSPIDTFKHSNAAGLSINAKINVARYIPTRSMTPRMDKIRFVFFMVEFLSVYVELLRQKGRQGELREKICVPGLYYLRS